jgi:proteasome lid subunit RPN8/RPN11
MVNWFSRWLLDLFLPPIHHITMADSALEDLCEMASAAHPKEMMAFLASTKGNRKGVLHIDEIQLQAYNASGDSATVMLSNLPMTTSIIGTVHSHPGGSLRPSDADLHLYSKFGYVHAIIGEPYRKTNIKFYGKRGQPILVRVV